MSQDDILSDIEILNLLTPGDTGVTKLHRRTVRHCAALPVAGSHISSVESACWVAPYLLALQPDVCLPAPSPDVVCDTPEGAGGAATLLGQCLAGCGSTVPGGGEGKERWGEGGREDGGRGREGMRSVHEGMRPLSGS
jgi:hypothetical protein